MSNKYETNLTITNMNDERFTYKNNIVLLGQAN